MNNNVSTWVRQACRGLGWIGGIEIGDMVCRITAGYPTREGAVNALVVMLNRLSVEAAVENMD